MYHPTKNQAYYICLKLLGYLFLYPSEWQQAKKNIYNFIAFWFRVVGSFAYFMCILHPIMSLINNVPIDFSPDLTGATALGNSELICIVFQLTTKRWSKLFVQISNHQKFGTPPKLEKVVRNNNLIGLVYAVYCYFGICAYCALSYFDTARCRELNEKYKIHEICNSFTPLWWFNEQIPSSLLVIFNFLLFISVGSFIPCSGLISFLAWESSRLMQLKIDHLKCLFRSAFNTKNNEIAAKKLGFCIKYHQEIIRLSEMMNKLVQLTLGHMGVVSALALSCIGTQMLKQYSVGAFIYLIGVFVAVFLLCQTGQRMITETYSIQDAVYESKWYQIDPKLAKNLGFIMMRSQKPICMEITPFGIFNYGLMITIIKTSYSYLTLMYQTN